MPAMSGISTLCFSSTEAVIGPQIDHLLFRRVGEPPEGQPGDSNDNQ